MESNSDNSHYENYNNNDDENIIFYDQETSELRLLSKDFMINQEQSFASYGSLSLPLPFDVFSLCSKRMFLTANRFIMSYNGILHNDHYELRLYSFDSTSFKKQQKQNIDQKKSMSNNQEQQENEKSFLRKSAFSVVDKLQSGPMLQPLPEFAFNAKRELLAGLPDYLNNVRYHLWKPDVEGLHLLRQSKNNLNPDDIFIDTELTSLDFSFDGERLATLSNEMQLAVCDVNSNLVIHKLNSKAQWTSDEYFDCYRSCRWNSDSTSIFTLSSNPYKSISLIDVERDKIVMNGCQNSLKIRCMEISQINRNLLLCGLMTDGEAVVYDTRKSLYFPVNYFAQGKEAKDERRAKSANSKMLKMYELNAVYRGRCSAKWSTKRETELLLSTLDDIQIIDTRNSLATKLLDTKKSYFASFVC